MKDDVEDENAYKFAPVHTMRRDKKLSSSNLSSSKDYVEDENANKFTPVHAMRRDKEKPSSSDSSGLEDDIEDEDTYEFTSVHVTRRDKEKPSSLNTALKYVTAIASRNVMTVLASEASASTYHFQYHFDILRVI